MPAGMELDFSSLTPLDRYRFLTSVVVPRPIAWVTTLDGDGVINAAPFSFFNIFGPKPPLLVLGIGNRPDTGEAKDTVLNIRQRGEFVVNLVSEALAERMVQTSAPLPRGESELELVGLAPSPSRSVTPPRIADSPVSLECRCHSIQEIGENRLIIGEIAHAHIADEFYDAPTRRVLTESMKLVGRMHGADGYAKTDSLFRIARPE